ncbi:MAG: hypothetical protein QMD04_12050 [Anaerolineales bacterium]|nr:hypothetical protein [Anaerolineales bacterium]
MTIAVRHSTVDKPLHDWLHPVNAAWVTGPSTPLLDRLLPELLDCFRREGHLVQDAPGDQTEILLTTAPFLEPLNWRDSVIFTGRRRFKLKHTPTTFTFMQATPTQFQDALDRFEEILRPASPTPDNFAFPGLAASAYHTLYEQGKRGGPIMALLRVLQAQSKSIRIVLVVADDHPLEAYHFDLVGSYPRSNGSNPDAFYTDIARRMVTAVCTHEITRHEVSGEPILRAAWDRLTTPKAMQAVARQLGQRGFFTEMIRIAELVSVPAIADTVSSQYSEGCFATWDAELGALVATITGSARPVDKGNITEDDLAVIVGVRPDGQGARVRRVEGKANHSPSSEAVEMMSMDGRLPKINLGSEWGVGAQVPVVRSKLHGHRGIAAYDPRYAEYAPLDAPYYHYPVSCATEAQARGIMQAFSRAECLRNPDDPRQIAFTVLPGHGCMIVEKWVRGTMPFQTIWEAMDRGYVVVENRVPQGPMDYAPDSGQILTLRE